MLEPCRYRLDRVRLCGTSGTVPPLGPWRPLGSAKRGAEPRSEIQIMKNTDPSPASVSSPKALSGVTRLERPIVGYVIRRTTDTPTAAVNKFTNRYGERAAGQLLSAYIAIFIGALWALAAIMAMVVSSSGSVLETCFLGLCGVSLFAGFWRIGSARRSATHRPVG